MIIQIERSTAKALKKLGIAKKETYDEIIMRLIHNYKENNSQNRDKMRNR